MTQKSFVRIYNTPKGPQVYAGDFRIHHWMAGLVTAGIGVLGLLVDENKKRRGFYFLLCLAGTIAFLDDLPDFVSVLQENLKFVQHRSSPSLA